MLFYYFLFFFNAVLGVPASLVSLENSRHWFWMNGFAILVRVALTLFYVPYISLNADPTESYEVGDCQLGVPCFQLWWMLRNVALEANVRE